jgi:hypothetical protein
LPPRRRLLGQLNLCGRGAFSETALAGSAWRQESSMGDDDDPQGAKGRGSAAAARQAEAIAEAVPEVEEEIEDELGEQLSSLRGQIADIAREIEGLAAEAVLEARDLARGASYMGAMAARRAGRTAVSAARGVREDPLPMVIGLGVLALLTAMILRERR